MHRKKFTIIFKKLLFFLQSYCIIYPNMEIGAIKMNDSKNDNLLEENTSLNNDSYKDYEEYQLEKNRRSERRKTKKVIFLVIITMAIAAIITLLILNMLSR